MFLSDRISLLSKLLSVHVLKVAKFLSTKLGLGLGLCFRKGHLFRQTAVVKNFRSAKAYAPISTADICIQLQMAALTVTSDSSHGYILKNTILMLLMY